jgi:hypothetical protein
MNCAFWEWMLRGEENAPATEDGSLEEIGLRIREGKLKSRYGPYRARDFFKIPMDRKHGPIWTFERYGLTKTELPDGRVVCIGGEHEDSYDPDFYIYNDVIVFLSDGEIEIYGYPKEIFPPTDFHSATLLGDRIIVVGCLGNRGDRSPGFTPVYCVDTRDYSISELTTGGKPPGWIFKHVAKPMGDGVIRVHGGQLVECEGEQQLFRRNNEEFELDTKSRTWTQITNRNWLQWSIVREDRGVFVLEHHVSVADLIPPGAERLSVMEGLYHEARFLLQGVPIRLITGINAVEIVVEGVLPEKIVRQLPEIFRERVELLCKKKCVLNWCRKR